MSAGSRAVTYQERFGMLRYQSVPVLIGLLMVIVPSIPAASDDPRWHGCRSAAFEAGAALLLAVILAQNWDKERRKQWAEAWQTPTLRLLASLLLWGGLSALLTPAKAFAVQGLLLWGGGTLIALAVAAEARARPQFELLFHALTLATFLVSLAGLALYGAHKMPLAVGLYSDHMLFGAVFTVLLPLMLALSLSPIPAWRRLTAQAALLCGMVALGLSETRSAWVGFALALFVFAGLTIFVRIEQPRDHRQGADRNGRRVQTIISAILVLGVIIYFVTALPQIGQVGARFRTFTTTVPQGKETSVEWRFTAWQGAEEMIRQKPWVGWGIGCYPRYQSRFTGMGQDGRTVEAQGPTIPDEAHNSYLQIAAEMGLPGLVIWLSVLISALVLGTRALRRLNTGSPRQWALIGCLSALTGQAADAFANPGWQFGEVSLFLWVTLGLTVALALGQPEKGDAPRIPDRFSTRTVGTQAVQVLLGTLVFGGLLWVISQTMGVLPAPKL